MRKESYMMSQTDPNNSSHKHTNGSPSFDNQQMIVITEPSLSGTQMADKFKKVSLLMKGVIAWKRHVYVMS